MLRKAAQFLPAFQSPLMYVAPLVSVRSDQDVPPKISGETWKTIIITGLSGSST